MKDLPDNRLKSLGTKLTVSDVSKCVLAKLTQSQKVEG